MPPLQMCRTLALLASVDVAIHAQLSTGGAWEERRSSMLAGPLAGGCAGPRVARGLLEVSQAVAKPPQSHTQPLARPGSRDVQVCLPPQPVLTHGSVDLLPARTSAQYH